MSNLLRPQRGSLLTGLRPGPLLVVLALLLAPALSSPTGIRPEPPAALFALSTAEQDLPDLIRAYAETTTVNPVFALSTAEQDLPDLIRAYTEATTVNPDTGHAECNINLTDAVFLFDRISDGGFERAVKNDLLKLLLTKVNTKIFFALIAADGATVDTVLPSTELQLELNHPFALISGIKGLNFDEELSKVPEAVIGIIDTAVAGFKERIKEHCENYGPKSFRTFRLGELPAPFDTLYPYNRQVIGTVFKMLYNERIPIPDMEPLLLLGLRPTIHTISSAIETPEDPKFASIMPLAIPDTHLFHNLKIQPTRSKLTDAVVVHASGNAQKNLGTLTLFLTSKGTTFLPALLELKHFASYLSRHPDQFHAAVSAMAANLQWGFFNRLSGFETLLSLPVFTTLANDIVDCLIHDLPSSKRADMSADYVWCPPDRVHITMETYLNLLTLPNVDLLKPSLSGDIPFIHLFKNESKFQSVLHDPEFLQHAASNPKELLSLLACMDADVSQRVFKAFRVQNAIQLRFRLISTEEEDED